MPLRLLVALLLLTAAACAQSGSGTDSGGTTRHDFGGVGATRQSSGQMDVDDSRNMTDAMRNRIDETDYYSSSGPGMSGTTDRTGDRTLGTGRDGSPSTQQSVDDLTLHDFRNGRTCTSNIVGGSTITTCP